MKNNTKQEKYDRDSCDICSNRFECEKVKSYDNGKKIDLHNCIAFDDVYAK